MPLRTAVYLRRSSHDREDKQVHSIERQREDILEFLDKHNGTVVSPAEQLTSDPVKDFYVEDASAKIVDRKEFNRMVGILKKRQYDVLLCTELSRLSRNAVDNGVLVQLLEDGHLKIIRTMDHVFRDTPTDKFTLALFLTVSKYENDQRAMNTRSGLKLRRGAGATTFKAPMGYINAGTEKGRKWVEGDGENFERVQRLWDLFRTGSYTFKTLTDEALSTGVTVLGAKGERKPPSQSTVRYMLSNRYYCGEVAQKDETGEIRWKKGEHPAMVTSVEFEEVQLLLQKNGHRHAKLDHAPDIAKLIKTVAVSGLYTVHNEKGEPLPASIIFERKTRYKCTHCGERYSAATPKPCTKCATPVTAATHVQVSEFFSHFTEEGKKVDSLKLSTVLETLEKELNRIVITPALFEVFRRQLYTQWLEEEKVYTGKRARLRKDMDALEKEKGKLHRKGFEDEGSKEGLDVAIASVTDDLETKDQALKDLAEAHEESFDRAWQRLQVLRDAKDLLVPSEDFEPKKRLLLSLISNLRFLKGKIEVEWKKPFDGVAKAALAKKKGSAGPTECLGASSIGSP